jgi:hypothetical protein
MHQPVYVGKYDFTSQFIPSKYKWRKDRDFLRVGGAGRARALGRRY